MKRSEVVNLIIETLADSDDRDTWEQDAEAIINKLEDENIITPRYFKPTEDGMHKIYYGWEPEGE